MVERQTRAKPAVTPLQRTLSTMAARMPDVDEVAAIRALMRGQAEPGQQRRAVTYMLSQLCGVGSIPFTGEHTEGTAFRCGSMAVGIAMAQIADAVLLRFPDGHSPDGHSPDAFPAHSPRK